MSFERGRVRERDISEKMGTEPVPKEKVSTERTTTRISTDPPGILRDTNIANGGGESNAPRKWNTNIPPILPHERVFPIQIGSELFRLSGASISSDAPSYFSQFFQCQLETAKERGEDTNSVRTLYIDRDPVTFKDISLHLQGYHITPRDGEHFVKLFADAQFYSLPRLMSQLFEESIFISIGHVDFQIPRSLFSDPGNSPNYFSLGFAIFFSTPTEIFPGLNRDGLLRPPSILPPSVSNRSAETFREILHLLRGYPVEIRNETHRAELLRDCKYFHLKGLEQKLIRHEISYNSTRKRHEIMLRLEDVRQSGISVIGDPSSSSSPQQEDVTTPTISASTSFPPNATFNPLPDLVGYVNYARPFIDTSPHELLLEIGSSSTKLHLSLSRAEFFGDSKARVSRLFGVVATKLNLPTTQPLGLLMKRGGMEGLPVSPGSSGVSEDLVRVVIDEETDVTLDGKEWRGNVNSLADERAGEISTPSVAAFGDDWLAEQLPPHKRRKGGDGASLPISATNSGGVGVPGTKEGEEWVIKTGLWRLRVQNSSSGGKGGVECVLIAVKIDAVSGELGRNKQRRFLTD